MGIADADRGMPRPEPLDELAEHCLAARDLIDVLGEPVMRAAIDLLLAEIGRALASPRPEEGGAAG